MTRYSISDGNTELVIGKDASRMVRSEKKDTPIWVKFQVVTASGGDVRFARGVEKSTIETAETLKEGDVLYMDPRGFEWYAHADGTDVTVETSMIYYDIMEAH